MKYYFYIENKIKKGPFSLDELKDKRINHSTLVWTEGLSDWTKASDLDDVKDIIVSEPPPIPVASKAYSQRGALFSGVILGLFQLLTVALSFNYNLTIYELWYFYLIIQVVGIAFIFWVDEIAKEQNRNRIFWDIFAFIAPSLALIIIGFLRKKARDNE